MYGVEPRLRSRLTADLAPLVHAASEVLEGRLVSQRAFRITVEFADVPRLGSLELVRARGTTLVLCLQWVLVRPGDEGIAEAPRLCHGESFNASYLLVPLVVRYYHCGEL